MLCYSRADMRESLDLLTLSTSELESLLKPSGAPPYRPNQILRWLYQRRITDVESMTDVPKKERMWLAERASISCLKIGEIREAIDGTQKFVFSLDDGLAVESVAIPDQDRLTLCLSTQVGCTLDCAFCLTGRMGMLRNLKFHEIIGQVLAVQRHLGQQVLTNIVLMGMGEPLANLDAVEEAVSRLTNRRWGLGFSPRRITLSTAGLAPRLKRVADMGVNLAVSLNASNETQRSRLMPAANHTYSLKSLVDACKKYPLKPHRRLTFEYVLLRGENDSMEDAERVAHLVRGIRCKINLIPFNEFPESPFRRPSDEAVLRFQKTLTGHGLDVFIRKSKGQDVLGACGQLGSLEPLRLEPRRKRAEHVMLQPELVSS
jgi:23S rRNA (adenine2503-C2)-methyltransferase